MLTPSPLATPNVSMETPPTTTSATASRSRPMLVKQKQSFQFPDPADVDPDDLKAGPVTAATAVEESSKEEIVIRGSVEPEGVDPPLGAPKDNDGDSFKKVEKEKVKSAPVSFDRDDVDRWMGGSGKGSGRGKVLKQSSLDVEFMADRERLQVHNITLNGSKKI